MLRPIVSLVQHLGPSPHAPKAQRYLVAASLIRIPTGTKPYK